jgi:hypothetical protein
VILVRLLHQQLKGELIEMKRFFVVSAVTALVVVCSTQHLLAQRVWYRGNVRETIRQLETDTDQFKSSLDRALDHSPLNGTRTEDEINGYVKNFEEATDRLHDRAEDREYAPRLAREVLNRGRAINNFMTTHRLGRDAETDWARVRNDLNRLANGYYVRWRW